MAKMESLQGVGASAGIGIGRVLVIEERPLEYPSHAVDDGEAEKARFQAAIDKFVAYTAQQADTLRESIGKREAEILTGHTMMIADPRMRSEMDKLIDDGACAEDALSQVCDMFATTFEASGDELTRQRATDVRDVKQGVLAELLDRRPAPMSALPQGVIVVTHDLTPSMIAAITPGTVAGLVAETGGITSHSAILARAMEIPTVLGVPGATAILANCDPIIIDGQAGSITINPDQAGLAAAREEQRLFEQERAELTKFAGSRTVTADGHEVKLLANIGSPDDANRAMRQGAEGVGLFRTEFLFMDGSALPTEEEQFAAYRKAALICGSKPLIIRTLDIGGDKEIPSMGAKREDNPLMGLRAIRYCLARKDVYRTQLRALLRASAFGNVHIMVPMVTCVDEVRNVRHLVQRCMEEFDREGVAYSPDIQLGCVMETPAASLIADLLAIEADFFSIGTNDLTGYTMVADRGNDRVRYLRNTYDPAVLRSIRNIVEAGAQAGIAVGMCGEAAADPLLIPLWIAFGIDEYSVSAPYVLATRKQIFRWTLSDARELADRVMQLPTASEVRDTLQRACSERK